MIKLTTNLKNLSFFTSKKKIVFGVSKVFYGTIYKVEKDGDN